MRVAVVLATLAASAVWAPPASAAVVRAQNGQACTVVGTKGNDRLRAVHARDVVCGLGGNDVLVGGTGADVLDGGPGNDTLSAGSGADVLLGGGGDDKLSGGAGNDRLDGATGNDQLDGATGNDRIDGAAGDDTLKGGTGNDRLDGSTGNDVLDGGSGSDRLDGGPGANACVPDEGDITVGTSCSDTAGPVMDPAGIAWAGDAEVSNVKATTVTLRVPVTDDRSGVSSVFAYLRGPGGTQLVGATSEPVTGTVLDGIFEVPVIVPVGAAAGQWRLRYLCAHDRLRQRTCFNADADGVFHRVSSAYLDDFDGPVVPVELEPLAVVGPAADVAAPVLDPEGIEWLTGTTVDNATAPTLRLRLHVTDDVTGTPGVNASLINSEDPAAAVGLPGSGLPVSGTPTDGIWVLSGTVRPYTAAGTWSVRICLNDVLEHRVCYRRGPEGHYIDEETGAAAGFDIPPVTITGPSDRTAGTIDPTSLAWAGPSTFVNNVENQVTLRMRVTDDLSGIGHAGVLLGIPGVTDINAGAVGLYGSVRLVSGTPRDGVWEISGTLPRYVKAGTWRPLAIFANDKLGHQSGYRLEPDGRYHDYAGAVTDLSLPALTIKDSKQVG